MDLNTKRKVTEYLKAYVSDERWERLNNVLANRTRHITVVLEDLYQPHNASAVLRSCDGFGIQDVHVVENRNVFDASKGVTIGADKWLTLSKYNSEESQNTRACFKALREKGYNIIATTPHEQDSNLPNLDINDKTALVFGAELEGLSDEALELADGYMKIPMYGFSESFNISVSAAITLYDVTSRMRNNRSDWGLTDDEKDELLYLWVKQSIKAGEELEAHFLKTL